MWRLYQGKATVARVEKKQSPVSELQYRKLQFRHWGGSEEGKRAASGFGGWFRESISERPREAMIWPGYFPEARQ